MDENMSGKLSIQSSPGTTTNKSLNQYKGASWPVNAADYETIACIGTGKFSAVWSGYCKPNQLKVCIKTMDLESSTCSFEEILQEVQTMRLCDFPNILGCFCSFVYLDQLWLISQFMAKGSSARVMEIFNTRNHVEGFTEDIVAYLLHETLKGLNYLHSRGLIHRNVKAGNILLDNQGGVKLADFGFIASTEQHVKTVIQHSSYLYNMAPEVMDNNKAKEMDYRSDIWSIGITALELAKGVTPYAKYASTNLLTYIQNNEPPSLASYSHEKQLHAQGNPFSKFFDEFYKKCLQKNTQLRPSVGELLKHKLLRHTSREGLVQILTQIPNGDEPLDPDRTTPIVQSMHSLHAVDYPPSRGDDVTTPKLSSSPKFPSAYGTSSFVTGMSSHSHSQSNLSSHSRDNIVEIDRILCGTGGVAGGSGGGGGIATSVTNSPSQGSNSTTTLPNSSNTPHTNSNHFFTPLHSTHTSSHNMTYPMTINSPFPSTSSLMQKLEQLEEHGMMMMSSANTTTTAAAASASEFAPGTSWVFDDEQKPPMIEENDVQPLPLPSVLPSLLSGTQESPIDAVATSTTEIINNMSTSSMMTRTLSDGIASVTSEDFNLVHELSSSTSSSMLSPSSPPLHTHPSSSLLEVSSPEQALVGDLSSVLVECSVSTILTTPTPTAATRKHRCSSSESIEMSMDSINLQEESSVFALDDININQ